MNHIIKSATLKLFHYETIDDYSKHLAKFLNYYNFGKKLKRLRFKSPHDIILKKYQDKPDLFGSTAFLMDKHPIHHKRTKSHF